MQHLHEHRYLYTYTHTYTYTCVCLYRTSWVYLKILNKLAMSNACVGGRLSMVYDLPRFIA